VKRTVGIAIAAGILLAAFALPSAGGLMAQSVSSGPLAPLNAGANCAQGSHSVHLAPPNGGATNDILAWYDQIGSEGGGTVYLDAGVFTLDSTLNFQGYGNVTIQGAGEGRTTIAMEPDPVGHFEGTDGAKLGHVPSGESANLIEVSGTEGPIWNFEMCDLTVNANANSAGEAWRGSTIYDYSGGHHHVYEDIAETGFFGPGTTPNGLHLEPSPGGTAARDYVINGLTADHNSLPFEAYPGYVGGPNFLNLGPLIDPHVTNVTGIGLVALEVAPSYDGFFGYWTISGHMLIDPSSGGSWGGSRFAHIIVAENGTAAPNALQIDVASNSPNAPFTDMQWVDDAFYGPVLNANNMVWVTYSLFDGGLNMLPAHFAWDKVLYSNPGPDHVGLPIEMDGTPEGGQQDLVEHDVFRLWNDTQSRAPFWFTVPDIEMLDDSVYSSHTRASYLAASSPLTLSTSSCFSGVIYDPSGTATPSLSLIDLLASPGFIEAGAWVSHLTRIQDDLVIHRAEPATCHSLLRAGPDSSQPTGGTRELSAPVWPPWIDSSSASASPAPAVSVELYQTPRAVTSLTPTPLALASGPP
jgi:hypothetical protein